MSKKTREKSSKTSSGKAARAKSGTPRAPSLASAKTRVSKTRRATASKSSNNANKKRGKANPGTSHKAATKRSISASAAKSGNPPVKKTATARAAASAARESVLSEGAKAPAFRLPCDGGAPVSLSDYAGRKLVLFIYPRADTPGCTKEAIDFTRLAGAFAESQTAVLGVSADPLKALEAFRDKHRLSVPLVSDEKLEMLEAYGAWGEKSMYGKTFQGTFRTTVLIGADGRILRVWRNVRVDGHADEVLAAVRAG